MNPRRLYRSRTDRKLAGIAAGMAEYLGLDPTVVRVLWVVSIFFFGFTILIYIILAFVIPNEPLPAGSGEWPMWTAPGATAAATTASGPAAPTAPAPTAPAAPEMTTPEPPAPTDAHDPAGAPDPAGADPDPAAR